MFQKQEINVCSTVFRYKICIPSAHQNGNIFLTRHHKNFLSEKHHLLFHLRSMTNPLLVCPPCFIRSTARKHVSVLWFYQESTCFFPMSDIQTPLYIKELTSSQIKSKILISLWELDSIFYHLNGPCLHQITGYHHIFLISIQKKNYLFSI